MIQVTSPEYNFSKHGDIAFVPTMGNLHEGHLNLIKAAKLESCFVIVSIFINPLQFNNANDLINYPKSIEADIKLLEAAGCDLAFIPEETILNDIDSIQASEQSNVLCGKSRPGHFDGVLTIVNRLFTIIDPKIAFFGLKDYQQFILIKNYATQHYSNLLIKGVPTTRDISGLALSSRNNLLNPHELDLAANIFKELCLIRTNFSLDKIDLLASEAKKNLEKLGFDIDYLDYLDGLSLKKINSSTSIIIIAIAVRLGQIRLIDNIIVNGV